MCRNFNGANERFAWKFSSQLEPANSWMRVCRMIFILNTFLFVLLCSFGVQLKTDSVASNDLDASTRASICQITTGRFAK